MLFNQIKIAWRNLKSNKLQTIINLFGLTLGTVSCLAILVYVFEQTGYELHHENSNKIYRVETSIDRNEKEIEKTARTSPPVAFAIKENYPEVIEATRIVLTDATFTNPIRSQKGGNSYYEPRAYLADSTFFKVFTYKFIEGNEETALDEPHAIVLSSSLAKKLFGNEIAFGQSVIWGSGKYAQNLTVKGVFDDTFGKSHLDPNYIISMSTPGFGGFIQTFGNFAIYQRVYSYIKLSPEGNAKELQDKLLDFMAFHGSNDMANAGIDRIGLSLIKISDIHLYSSGTKNQVSAISDIKYLYFLLILALFIQLTACVNFVNLSTARAAKRAKEIGIRKVMGANKFSLSRQFLLESLLLSLFVTVLSIPVTLLFLPLINDLMQGDFVLLDFFNWNVLLLLLILGILTGLFAGVYPAVFLASFKPINALKGKSGKHPSSGNFRKGLVVFQYVISISLIVVVLVVSEQFEYILQKDLGFKKENLLTVRVESDASTSKYKSLMDAYLNTPGIKDIASSRYAPSEMIISEGEMYLSQNTAMQSTLIKMNGVSKSYFETMHIPLTLGRGFREGDDRFKIIVNEAALEAFNIDRELAQNTKLLRKSKESVLEYEIIGVVSNFNFASLKDKIEPLFLYQSYEPNWLILRTETQNFTQLLSNLEEQWNLAYNDSPFDYTFVDHELSMLYQEEGQLTKIFLVFTFLAILISCLGLFGLVSYVAEQRKKEIGIRKVLGASINSIIKLLTKDYMKLVLMAFLIAVPVSYLLMQRWLENYTYKIDVAWWIFILAGIGALGITLLTVGFQSVKSATINPIKSIGAE